ncbi:hypothetical protein E2C01_001632 [Portunus trituberculatus]|uniref:Uncharacterized protein n=1 Tax=Portunus trituberculatus TaxID=210409 RepID=A0A5B7CI45_PORTR|nr:hypothetical protein [Portunus trituberculatus]
MTNLKVTHAVAPHDKTQRSCLRAPPKGTTLPGTVLPSILYHLIFHCNPSFLPPPPPPLPLPPSISVGLVPRVVATLIFSLTR